MPNKKSRLRISAIWWHDAKYSSRKTLAKLPDQDSDWNLTLGIIVQRTVAHIRVGMNCNFDVTTGSVAVTDGLLIPRGAIVAIRRIGYAQAPRRPR